MKPAIVAVGYNRPAALKRLLSSIESAYYCEDDITLIISLDKAENESEVLDVAKKSIWLHGEKIIRTFNERQGLRKHIIQCGDLSNKYEAVIILEDDLIVSPGFYTYTKLALDYYSNSTSIAGIALYSHEWNGYAYKFFSPTCDKYDTFLGQFSITWGQCWSKEWWNSFKDWYIQHEDKLEFNENIPTSINNWSQQSWGKYFVNYIVEKNKYYVIPRVSLSTNCSEIGQHAKTHDSDHQVRLLHDVKTDYAFAPETDALKYDIFFESMNLHKALNKYSHSGVCVDLAGYGRVDNNARYVLSTNRLPYEIEKQYGLELRPTEMNVLCNVSGDGIYLYDTHKPASATKDDYKMIRYEIRGIRNKFLIKYVIKVVINKVLRRK